MVKNIYKTYLLIGICLFAGMLTGCTKEKEPISKTGFYFDTVIQLVIYEEEDSTLLDTCFAYCEEFEKKISRTLPDSEISRINQAKGKPVQVSDETIELLQTGIAYGELSGGTFDITVAPLSNLWNFKDDKHVLPTKAELHEACSHVDYRKIHIEGNEVTLQDPEAAIDLGGIAKGYMADKLKDFLLSQGVERGMINLGGNVLTIGQKADGSAWNIGIRRPFDEKNGVMTSVSVQDSSVVTSGSYERYFRTEDGRLYHHILDPKTGYPCDTELYSVTILSEESVDGDALSTICFALGLEKGKALIEKMDGVEALFVTDTYEVIDTRK